MKKTVRLSLAVMLMCTVSGGQASAAFFSDVPDTNRNVQAIEYLAVSGIISGYPDGTFKPDQNINRAEFLKIALGASGIATDATDVTGFPDVDESAWYAKYIRKAKSEGWIEGYPDGTFKPEQQVNKAEAIKIISGIQGWNINKDFIKLPYKDTARTAWYTPHIYYAKSKNFLEETGDFFIPEAYYSRAKMSEVLFRTYITAKNESDTYSTNLIYQYPAEAPTGSTSTPVIPDAVPQNFTSVDFSMISADFFDGIHLQSDFPTIFYANEVYFFDGTVDQNDATKTFAFLSPKDGPGSDQYTTYVDDEVQNASFSIPIIFRTPGNYRLGMIVGNSGESKVIDISVLPSLPEAQNQKTPAVTPLLPQISYQNRQTDITWKNNTLDLIRVIAYQGDQTRTFLFRQKRELFPVDYTDFINFSEGTVSLTIQGTKVSSTYPLTIDSGWSQGVTKSFFAVTHEYSSVDDGLKLDHLPETLTDVSSITVTGTSSSNVYLDAAVIKPDGNVDTFNLTTTGSTSEYFGSKIIPAGNQFTFSYQPANPGTYLIEINGTDGSAVLNTPVYVKTGTPLIPDFFDLNRYTEPQADFSLVDARSKMLQLINAERAKMGLNGIKADDALNNLAQLHAEDMVNRDYFSHVTPEGKTPNDRRIELGISTSVGENLAIAPTVDYTHYGLMQSAIHRKNILDPDWTKVGIGIARDANGYLVTTQEFSGDPLSLSDLNQIRNDMLTKMNARRSAASLPLLISDTDLQNASNSWSNKMATQKFFDFVSPNGETLENTVQQYVPDKAVQALILESTDDTKLIDESAQSAEITQSQWSKIGIGLAVDNVGTIKTTILFTTK